MSTPGQNTEFDIIIIGAGPGGLTAGLYASRAGMNTVLFEKIGIGGQILTSELVENYPGFPEGINGYELTEKMRAQAEKFGLSIRTEEVTEIRINSATANIVETNTQKYKSTAVIIAAGCNPTKLNIPGEQDLLGKGVSYCATCDGPLFRDREIAVVGGGNTAVSEALFLAKFAKHVRLIHRRSRLRAAKILQDRLLKHGIESGKDSKIEFVKDSIVTKIHGKDRVESISIKNVKTETVSEIPVDGIFIAVGIKPNTGFLKDVVEIDESGYIITDENMKTSSDGIFACGDVRKKKLRQVITACGEAATAAVSAQNYVEEMKGTSYGTYIPV